MTASARLTVLHGPDRGKTFPLSAELAHIGRDGANEVVLSDPRIAAHQASIVCRGGRFALFAPVADAVFVDGAAVPPQRWVWLPSTAEIGLGGATTVRFVRDLGAEVDGPAAEPPSMNGGSAESSSLPSASSVVFPAGEKSSRRSNQSAASNESGKQESPKPVRSGGAAAAEAASPAAARSEGSSSSVRRRRRPAEARPANGRPAVESTVGVLARWSAEGQLPELTLAESSTHRAADSAERGGSSWLLIVAVGLSMAASTALLLWDVGGAAPQQAALSAAREQLREYFGVEGTPLLPYQQLLRQARMAHSQGRVLEERRLYLKVLDLLNAADAVDPQNLNGLTGRQTGRGRNSDRELRALLETLVAGGRVTGT